MELVDEQALAALDSYLHDVQTGRPSSRDRLLAAHPGLAEAVRCLDDLDRLAAKDVDDAPTLAQPGATPSPAPPSMPCFDKYEVEAEIRRGGMGVGYKARQKDLDR